MELNYPKPYRNKHCKMLILSCNKSPMQKSEWRKSKCKAYTKTPQSSYTRKFLFETTRQGDEIYIALKNHPCLERNNGLKITGIFFCWKVTGFHNSYSILFPTQFNGTRQIKKKKPSESSEYHLFIFY